jgi:hypothetical protein
MVGMCFVEYKTRAMRRFANTVEILPIVALLPLNHTISLVVRVGVVEQVRKQWTILDWHTRIVNVDFLVGHSSRLATT